MYDEPHDDDRDFWRDEPTRPLRRVAPDRLRHHAPAPDRPSAPIVATVVDAVQRRRSSGDPFVARIGIMVGAAVLLVPVALGLRSDDRGDQLSTGSVPAESTTGQPVAAVQPVAVAPTTVGLEATIAPASTVVLTTAAPAQSVAVSVAEPVAVAAPATSSAAPATATTAPAPKVQAAVAPVCTRSYEVVAGDYWILIATKVSVTTKELLAANNATTSTPLYPGRSICLPRNASAPTTAPAKPATTAAPVTTVAKKAPPSTAKPAPATTAPPPTTLPARTYTTAEVEAIIREVWPDELEDEALRIARRESNLQPTARNYCCVGLFQIYWSVHKSWLGQLGVTSAEQLFDPRVNAVAAYTLYQRAGGWGPWKL